MKGVLVNNKYYGIKKSNVNYGIANSEPLYFVAAEDNSTISITATNSPTYDLVYSTDGVNWQTFANSTSGVINTITLAHTNDKVYIKGTYTGSYVSNTTIRYITFIMTGKINSGGSVCSIIAADNYKTTTSSGFLYSLFNNCTSLLSAPELPAINLQERCYNRMFYGCTNLVYAPISLPATTLSQYCYFYMFYDCTNLITAPKLPSTTLVNQCYYGMFQNCTSLVQAPYLPATQLTTWCYANMFRGCTSLNYVKIAFTGKFNTASSVSNWHTTNWLTNVSSTGNFYYNGSDTTRGGSAIPTGWTVHTF